MSRSKPAFDDGVGTIGQFVGKDKVQTGAKPSRLGARANSQTQQQTLLQVQYSKDLKKDQSLIHTLMGNDVALRKDFIISNSINVQNLDI